jgi:hypothetical protein
MPASKKIRPLLGFSRMSDNDILFRGRAVLDGLTGNPAYPNPSVDLAAFGGALGRYAAAIGETLDGGKKATAEKNRLREEVIQMMQQLGHYVQAKCENDIALFTSSGFAPVPTSLAPPQSLPQPSILKIDQGDSGQLLVSITPLYRKARSYELRYAALTSDGTPGPWTTIALTKARPAVRVDNLTPATTYAFQVRALGHRGFTDWSDSATRMCT